MRENIFEKLKVFILRYFHSRIAVVTTLMCVLFCVLIGRIFYLQILNGEEYKNEHTLTILKTRTQNATRGTIYDRNGNVLAYDKLAYAVTFEDTGDYTTNARMNEKLILIIEMIEENGDVIDTNDFKIIRSNNRFEFTVSGTSLDRFKADVYGHSNTTDLSASEATSDAESIFVYLCDKYGIYTSVNEDEAKKDDVILDMDMAMNLLSIRYAMAANSYQKYINTTIASDVSEQTVADIEENSADILGLEIEENTIRVYNNSEYFAHIIGYTGTISNEEYEALSEERSDYTLNDKVGKSGIEEYCETYLQGIKGSEEVYVDNLGTVLEVADSTDPVAGNDVYLTIDMDLQMAVYDLLEKELASILYYKIEDVEDYDTSSESSSSDIIIPIDDVYYALIENSVLDISHFESDDAGTYEKTLKSAYDSYSAGMISRLKTELTGTSPIAFGILNDELAEYENFIMDTLYNDGIVNKDAVDTESEEYLAWKDGTGTLADYLLYNIAQDNLDISGFDIEDKYADKDEIYDALVNYIADNILSGTEFEKHVFKYMIENDAVGGREICLTLYEQGVLTQDDNYSALYNGDVTSYEFIRDRIKDLDITPAQLALDPCNASCVILNPGDGEVLACVTYPGYDNNKMANSVDSDYYAALTADLSYPLLNYATQQKTAPGSTFKMITATAALTEKYVAVDEEIEDEGIFEAVDPSPKCWIYPSNHGTINISEAIRDSCNYFFFELGYRMSTNNETANYNDDTGLSILNKYASLYGLDSNTGIEISEAEPNISDNDAVRSAIGQGTNNYTTTQLARYVSTVANSGTCYNLSLILKVADKNENVIEEYESSVYTELSDVSNVTWRAIQKGMHMDIETLDTFDDVKVTSAGKTGTAQESKLRANHALFVCYAPYRNPQIAVATRIPYGYTSSNAAEVTSYILKYYFNEGSIDEISQELSNAGGRSYVSD